MVERIRGDLWLAHGDLGLRAPAHHALLGSLCEPLAVLNHFARSLPQELPVLLWSRGWGNPRYDPILRVGRNNLPSLMAIVPGVSALLYRTNTLPDHVP